MNRFLPPRRLIPRWRKSSFAIHQADMLGLIKPLAGLPKFTTNEESVQWALNTWRNSESVGDLADVLAFGLDGSLRETLREPALIAMAHPGASHAMRLVAGEILEQGSSQAEVWRSTDRSSEIRAIRALLRLTPHNTIALVDLAQHHLANGKAKAAYRALTTAYQLSPNSVHVVRAFARYWVHLGHPDRAHAFIKNSGLANIDPWVMASEIAISQVAGQQSAQLRKAQRALVTKTFKPTDTSELAGALAGTEIRGGNFKEARKLFRLALEHPNDNVLAQAITSQTYIGIEIDEQVIKRAPNGAFEGRALNAMLAGDFELAAFFTAKWSLEESFSSRPRMLQSYFFGALGDYEQSLAAANMGLIADPDDESLRVNKSYALAGLGRFAEAEAELKALETRLLPEQKASLLATRGMVLMLKGEATEGIRLYEEAIDDFRKNKQEEQLTDCMAFMARTANFAKIEQHDEITRRAAERFKKTPSPAASVVLRSLNQSAKIEGPALRKIVQWEWNPTTNTLTENRELTRKGAPGIVLANKRK